MPFELCGLTGFLNNPYFKLGYIRDKGKLDIGSKEQRRNMPGNGICFEPLRAFQ
jgi:hypothetical protein